MNMSMNLERNDGYFFFLKKVNFLILDIDINNLYSYYQYYMMISPKTWYLAPLNSGLSIGFICLFQYFIGFKHLRGKMTILPLKHGVAAPPRCFFFHKSRDFVERL